MSNPVYISMEPLPTPDGGKSCVKSPGKSPMQGGGGKRGHHKVSLLVERVPTLGVAFMRPGVLYAYKRVFR